MGEDGGQIKLDVVPNFGSFGSLFSSGIRGALQTAQTEGAKIGGLLGGGLSTGVTVGAAAATIAIGDFVAAGMKDYLRLTDQARALERVTGGTAEETSLFAGVIRKMGFDVDAANRPLGIFASNIATHPELFRNAGVAIAHYKDGTTDVIGTLDNLRKQLGGVADADQRDAIARQLLSRGYQTLLPYLSLTNDRLAIYQRLAREGGEVFTQKDIDNARDYKVQVQQVSDVAERFKLQAGKTGVSIASSLISDLGAATKVTGNDIFGNLGKIGKDLVTPNALGPLGQLKAAVDDVTSGARREQAAEDDVARQMAAVEVATNEASAAAAEFAKQQDAVTSAADGLRSAEQSQVKAHEATEQAVRGVASAQHATQDAVHGLEEAQYSLNELYARGEQVERAVTTAEYGVEQAHRATRDATESLTDAQRKLNEAQQFGAEDSANELTNAHLDLASATLALAEAKQRAATTVPTASDPYAAQAARLGVQQATQRQREAQEALNKVQQFGTQADQNLTDAQRAVRDASEKVTDSLHGEDDAVEKLNEAQKGVAEYQHQIADAKYAVSQAAYGVQQAEEGERDASQKLKDARQEEENASIRVREAEDKLDETVRALGSDQNDMIDTLEKRYPELAGVVEQSYGRIKAAMSNLPAPPAPHTDIKPISIVGAGGAYDPATGQIPIVGAPPGRAAGGPVVPGRTYVVGEKGPELLRDGRVYPSGHAPPEVVPAPDANVERIDYDRLGQAVASALEGVEMRVDGMKFGELSILHSVRYRSAHAGMRS